MTLDEIDKSKLIYESYRIDGIELGECRSIFLDWALKLPDGLSQRDAIAMLIREYAEAVPDHPMSKVLRGGLGRVAHAGRRGGRAARHGD